MFELSFLLFHYSTKHPSNNECNLSYELIEYSISIKGNKLMMIIIRSIEANHVSNDIFEPYKYFVSMET